MDKGIVLFAFGKRGYGYAGYNLAFSIKKFSNLKVTLFTSKDLVNRFDNSVFDSIEILEDEEFKTNGRVDPAKIKCDMYSRLPYKHNLYLDVDALLLKDIEPFFDKCIEKEGFYFTDVIDSGGKEKEISYSIWATNEDIWKRFKLTDKATLPAIQSSWAYIEKCEEADLFFEDVKNEFEIGFPISKLEMRWGGTLPDELFYSSVCAKHNILPKFDERPIFFGNDYSPLKDSEIIDKYYILSIYGNGKGRTLTKYRYIDLYDKLMINYKKPERHLFKTSYIMPDKHANNWK